MLEGDAAHLLSAMAQYGYSLLQPDQMGDPNELLAALSRSDDGRVLEGFPVVLANAMEKRRDLVDLRSAEARLKTDDARERFRRLTALSFHLFRAFGLEALVPVGEGREMVDDGRPFRVGGKELDLGRVRRTFLRYYAQAKESQSAESKARLREDFRREYNLSLFFAPKQRDLLQKKMRGEALSKTEREYFSRVVKKKLLALADPDLHRLAMKALQ